MVLAFLVYINVHPVDVIWYTAIYADDIILSTPSAI